MSRYGTKLRRVAVTALAAGALAAGGTSAVASAAPSDVDTAADCYAWNTKAGPAYTDSGDASVELQARSCRHSDGSWRAYIRAKVCNRKTSGKSQMQIHLYRDGNQRLYLDTRSWPTVGSCDWSPGFRVYKGHDYTAGLSVYYTDGGNSFDSTSEWRYR